MQIEEAQCEVRRRFVGGFYGQLVSGLVWLASAVCGTWVGHPPAMAVLVIGGFAIFPLTELLVRLGGEKSALKDNPLSALGMQVAFVLPLSMPLLVPIVQYRPGLFYPAMMILLGAHYVPFVFLYGMKHFAALAAMLLAGGVFIALTGPYPFTSGAWYTAAVLFVIAFVGRALARTPTPGQA